VQSELDGEVEAGQHRHLHLRPRIVAERRAQARLLVVTHFRAKLTGSATCSALS
jgi:hypothetical protein